MNPVTSAKDKGIQILIVDDNKNNLKLLSGILLEHGYKVRLATGGNLALLSVAAQKPDLIILDIRMPDLDGYSVCRELKSHDDTRAIPVIFMSALDDVSDKVKGFETGAVDYITKPFEPAEVLIRVKTHLSLSILQNLLEEQNNQLEEEIEERVQAEEDLKRYQIHLEDIISDRTADLQELNKELLFQNVILVTQQETSLDGIIIFDEHGKIISYNQRFLDLWKIVSDRVRSLSLDNIKALFSENIINFDEQNNCVSILAFRSQVKTRSEFILKDGRTFDHYSSPIKDQGGRYFGRVCYFRDITDRRLYEREIREKTDELDRFFSLNLDLLAILNSAGNFRRLNPEWEKTFRYPLDELISHNITEFVHPDDENLTSRAIEDLHEQAAVLSFINRVRCQDNSYRWIEWRMIRFRDLIYTAARDITSRREADEKIQSGVQMLARTQETFATLNDQIRNPLSIISIYAEECEAGLGRKIQNEVIRIDNIVNQLDKGWIESDKVRRVMRRYFES